MKRFIALLLLAALAAQAGPIVISGPVKPTAAGPTQLAADTFDRSNEALSVSANWTADAAFQVSANAANTGGSGGDAQAEYTGIAWPNDQYSQVILDVTGTAGLGTGYGPTCRFATAAKTGYRLITSGSGWELLRFNAGASTSLGSSAGTTFAIGDTVYLSMVGAVWTVKKNGATVSGGTGTDGSPIASGNAGIAYSSTSAAADGIASWSGGTP